MCRVQPRSKVKVVANLAKLLAVEEAKCPVHGRVIGLVVRELDTVELKTPVTAVHPKVPSPAELGEATRSSLGRARDAQSLLLHLADLKVRLAELHRDEAPVAATNHPGGQPDQRVEEPVRKAGRGGRGHAGSIPTPARARTRIRLASLTISAGVAVFATDAPRAA